MTPSSSARRDQLLDAGPLRSPAPGPKAVIDPPSEEPAISDLLHVKKLLQMSVELTTSCNLACVYCHFAPLSRRGNDADGNLVENLINFVDTFPVDHVTMSGDAEITMYDGWELVAKRLLDHGVTLRTISNFSKGIFSEQEIDVFSQFQEILISLDTSDAAKLKKIRYRADLRTITCNMQLIRACAIANERPIPNFVCNVVTHDKNITEVDRTAAFAIANGFNQIYFLQYVTLDEVPGGINELFDNPNAMKVYPISTISKIEAAKGVRAFQRAVAICEKNTIRSTIWSGVLEDLQSAMGDGETENNENSAPLPPGTRRTKLCRMPWDYLQVRWNGDIPPCCIVKDTMISSAADRPITEIINSEEMMEWRRSLLTGDLKKECATCTYVPDTDTGTLQGMIRQYVESLGA